MRPNQVPQCGISDFSQLNQLFVEYAFLQKKRDLNIFDHVLDKKEQNTHCAPFCC